MELKQKILLLAILPLVVSIVSITFIVTQQSKELSEKAIEVFETKLLSAKKEELKNYISLAKTAIDHIYSDDSIPLARAQAEAREILNDLEFGPDGYFYVYDYKGNNIVHPKQPKRVGNNWWDLEDANGNLVIRNLIHMAKTGEGYHNYLWEKPSIQKVAEKIGYAETLDKWQWMIGTGLYIDDVHEQVELSRTEVNKRIHQTFITVVSITMIAVIVIFAAGLVINFSEKRLADSKLKALTQRVIGTQEEERSRVARELHDGISQILVSVKFALEKALRHSDTREHIAQKPMEMAVDKGLKQLHYAISEVRRISRDLRPGMLDDLGLSPALESLTNQFSERTGIRVDFKTTPLRNLLPKDAKTALYRIAQEALTNIERHADATHVRFNLCVKRQNIILSILDNGKGFATERVVESKRAGVGIGLKNMQERIEYFKGSFKILSSEKGTEIRAMIPKDITVAQTKTFDNIELRDAAE